AAIDRYKAYLKNPKSTQEPAQRSRIEGELRRAEDDLAREQAARAKGDEVLALGVERLAAGRVDEAQAQLDAFLHAPGNERPGLVRAALLRAAIALQRQERSAAEEAYADALALDRGLLPPREPEALAAFEAARARLG